MTGTTTTGGPPISAALVEPADPEDRSRRNSRLNVLDGIGWHIGLACLSYSAILPAYVSRLGGGPFASGAVVGIWTLGTRLPQALSSWWAHGRRETRPLILTIAVLQRLAVAALVAATAVAEPGPRALALFFLLYSLWSITTGLAFPVWVEFLGRSIRPTSTGRALGVRNAVASVASVAAAGLATLFLRHLAWPHGFTAVFALALAALSLGFVPLTLIRETPHAQAHREGTFMEYLRACARMAREDRTLRRLLVALALVGGMYVPIGLFLPYGLERLGQGLAATERDALAGHWTFVQTLALALAAWPSGRLADRIGSRPVVIAGALAGALCPVLALAAPSLRAYALVYAALGAATVAYNIALVKLYMDLARGGARTRAMVLAEGVTAPAILLATLGGGALASTIGYGPVFLGSAALTLAGVLALATLPAGAGGAASGEGATGAGAPRPAEP